MLKWLDGLLDSNEREIKRLQPLVAKINSLEPEFQRLTDAELRAKTDEFKARYRDRKKLDDLLPEAFAAVREAGRRTIGQRHFDVQLMGGIVLHQGKIAEMKTGEGKTLVATLPQYLNAITGEGCHLVTVNDYLAKRDCHWMGPIYHALGLTVACIQHDASFQYDPQHEAEDQRWRHLKPVSRKQAYQADITYGTNNEFGFDYLRDNMVLDLSQCVQRPLNYAIVDEVDYILIDEARTPLIISGAAEESAQKYQIFARLVPMLVKDTDYTVDLKDRAVSITDSGIAKMEAALRKEGLLKGPDLYDPSNYALTHYLDSALKAHVLFKRDKDYVVKNGEVIIVDEFTGRMMPGRRYSEGLHQAIEAKERVKVQRESVTLATITFQNYFRLYRKLAGMTGTAVTEAEEFAKIYKLEVVVIPTHREMIREDYPDQIYRTEEAKFKAVCNEVEKFHAEKRPVLIGTTSIETSERLSDMLTRRGIKHEVLNAKLHEKEAYVIAQAGRPGMVTVATNMAGRGVDIILGGELPTYRPYDDVNQRVLAGTLQFINQGIAFLKEQGIVKEWPQDLLDNLRRIKDAVAAQEGAIMRRRRDYAEAYTEQDEARIAEIGEDIKRQEQVLQQTFGTYESLVEEQARQIQAELEKCAARDGKPAVLQKIKTLIDARQKSRQGARTTAEVMLEQSQAFHEWLERHQQVMALGGLHVIGTERHEARRIDNQLRGRAGRQGDPGSSRFYVSMEDDIVKRFGGDRVKGLMEWGGMGEEDNPLELSMFNKVIENAQMKVEGFHFEIRKHLVDYDDVVNKHREIIYGERKRILQSANLKENILSMIREEIQELVSLHFDKEQSDVAGLLEEVKRIMPALPPDMTAQALAGVRPEEIEARLTNCAESLYESKEKELGEENMRMLERLVMLRVLDNLWTEHLTMMEHMRQGIGLQAVGHADPLVAYKKEGHALFQSLTANIRHDVVRVIYNANIVKREPSQQTAASKRHAAPANKETGRNDPCPCGSGKKYKKCCGK
ncbi:MAG: preprotein translocase subunit SecA [Dehalococcoidia bacterium]|nr:preprotein translocase subunit SecA [Dehalococcoidia bacterium]